jgi:hypothetical protein
MHPKRPHRTSHVIAATCLAVIVSCTACDSTDAKSGTSRAAATADRAGCGSAAAAEPATGAHRGRSVLAVSIDGLRPAAIRALGADRAPTLHRLVRQGASTMNARTTVEETRTLPNHATMLTGRPVARRRGGHGVDVNTDPGGTVHDLAGEGVSSVLRVVARHGGRPAMFASKDKFALFQRSWRCAMTRFVYREGNGALTDLVRRDLRRHQRGLRFVHYSAPDAAGHEHGFDSPRYEAAVAGTDRLLGGLVGAIVSSPRLSGRLTLIITSDHGGVGHKHDDPRLRSNYTVPFIAWGAGVSRGTNLYRLNPDRRRPGGDRVGYGGRQPIRNGDLANLALDVLGLPPVPGSQINRGQSLDLRPH